jgi:hypothetical protein
LAQFLNLVGNAKSNGPAKIILSLSGHPLIPFSHSAALRKQVRKDPNIGEQN